MQDWLHGFEDDVQEWHWWYQVRREILDALLARLELDPTRARLLDVGCGTGGAATVLARYGAAIGLDRAVGALQAGRHRPYRQFVQASFGGRLPFADGSFDVVCALDILEHLDDDRAGARELHRVLAPGGAAILFVPALSLLWGYNDVVNHHRRRYTRDQLVEVMHAAGFTVEDAGYFNLSLLLPTLAVRTLQRLWPSATQGMEHSRRWTRLNTLLLAIFRAELPLLQRGGHLPLGTSCYCLARR